MKGLLKATLFGAALATAGAGFAQSATSPQKGDEDRTPVSPSQPSSTDTNSMTSSSNTGTTATGSTAAATAPGTYTGTVNTIEAGRTIVITSADGKTQTFDISSSPTMSTSIAAGKRVRVIQTVDASGKTVVTVEPYR